MWPEIGESLLGWKQSPLERGGVLHAVAWQRHSSLNSCNTCSPNRWKENSTSSSRGPTTGNRSCTTPTVKPHCGRASLHMAKRRETIVGALFLSSGAVWCEEVSCGVRIVGMVEQVYTCEGNWDSSSAQSGFFCFSSLTTSFWYITSSTPRIRSLNNVYSRRCHEDGYPWLQILCLSPAHLLSPVPIWMERGVFLSNPMGE